MAEAQEVALAALLAQAESETLDFKATVYDLNDESSCLTLIKDVISMANTPRDSAAHIVLGVRKHPDGKAEVVGVDRHPDEADLQAQFVTRVYPIPSFSYRPVTVDGKSLAVIDIPAVRVGPCLPVRDWGGGMRQWQVYFRRGSRNDVATGQDMARIFAWFGAPPGVPLASAGMDAEWQQLVDELDGFAPGRRYVLLLSPHLRAGHEDLKALGRLPWDAVFDFDADGDRTGLLSVCRAALEERRSLHLATLRDRQTLNLGAATYWFFARGLTGREGTTELGPWRSWHKAYGAALAEQLRRLAAAALPQPVTCVALWYDHSLQRHLQTALEAMDASFGDALKLVVVTDDPAQVHPTTSELGAVTLAIPFHQFCSGIATSLAPDRVTSVGDVVLPSSSGAFIRMNARDWHWLAEELDIVDLEAGVAAPPNRSIGREFLRGAEIVWYELGLHYDIDRDLTDAIQQQVEMELSRRRISRINLYHAPGAGGTTVARRILWNLHRRYPCCVLRNTVPVETAERLFRLGSLTGLPIVLVVDGAQVGERQLDELYDYLRGRNIAVVVVQVLRRHTEQARRMRTFYLKAELSPTEADRFAHAFAREEPQRMREIQNLLASPDPRVRSAFYFGLQTFRTDFLGLQPFVAARLASLTAPQTKVIGFIALAHHYAQRSLPNQAFAPLLGLPANRVVSVEAVLPTATLELLVSGEGNRCRTVHEVVSEEILQQLLWPQAGDRRLWKQNLSAWAIEFAEFCAGGGPVASDELQEVARRTFIYRDNIELLGTERSAARQFSKLLEDIPSVEGRLEVLRHLVELFPHEPHFWAHLGRFYSSELGEYEKALECVERAIGLRSDDGVLHHMRGMALRQRAYRLMDEQANLTEVVAVAKDATESFARARDLNPDDDHGYISEVQLLAKVLDFSGRRYPGGVAGYLESPSADPFIRECFERAEDLLERVRRNREGQGASPYEEDCRAKLDALYGLHDRALQIWDGLLARQGVYRPPVRRQIVWTYLARRGRSWDGVPTREVDRIVSLLQDNLQEEPHSDTNLRLWVQAVRRSTHPPTIEAVIERVGYWRTNADSLEACFYLYVFYVLAALDGSVLARDNAMRFIDESRTRARFRRNRTKSFEWLGSGTGVGRLVHHSQLGEWLPETEFWESTGSLARVSGRIAKIDAPQAGQIEVKGGLPAFFVPGRGDYARGRSENQRVTFFLGFSYDGLRAWEVKDE
jgi:tetratricopeptide (TPR) repeat protein